MYEAVTNEIRVRVEPHYDEARSQPDASRYFWLYEIEIKNLSRETAQLVARRWEITDATGAREIVEGPGVVGKTPILRPGEAFRYTSGCPLTTSSGIMLGQFRMVDDRGAVFDVKVPAFSLDSPFDARTVN